MQFNDKGLLDPGIHEFNISDFCEMFVNNFDNSNRRLDIFKSLITFLNRLVIEYNLQEVWIDGSYVTNKINPNDVDIVLYFDVLDYVKLCPIWPTIRNFPNIDAYCACAVNNDSKSKLSPQDFGGITNNRNYWKGQFGFDRVDNPKGIILIKRDKIVEYINGGESNVN